MTTKLVAPISQILDGFSGQGFDVYFCLILGLFTLRRHAHRGPPILPSHHGVLPQGLTSLTVEAPNAG